MFKRCSCCRKEWSTLREFFEDVELRLLGVQDDPDPAQTLVSLEHECGTTLCIPVAWLLTAGVTFSELPACGWSAADGLPHGPERVIAPALSCTAAAMRRSDMYVAENT